jgi:tRNA modification GTPase
LLNRLVGKDRALVSAEPGTTRDFIEERIVVGPHCLRLIDTAGLNPSPAPLEKLGMDKTLERVAEADLFLVVLEKGDVELGLSAELAAKFNSMNTVIALNKSDLQYAGKRQIISLPEIPSIEVSALTGAGIDTLVQAIIACGDRFAVGAGADVVAINARHAEALSRAQQALDAAKAKLKENAPVELLASDLRDVLQSYGDISGRIDNERVLDELFASFCIGK